MAKLTRKLTKHDSEPWVLTTDEYISTYFTQEEINNIITPYNQILLNSPGYIANSKTEFYDGNTYTWTREYENLESLQSAMVEMSDENNPIVAARNQKLKEVMLANGVTSYKAETKIEA